MNSAADQTGSRGENGGAILCYTSKLSLLTNKPSLFDEETIYLLIESFFFNAVILTKPREYVLQVLILAKILGEKW